jgi:hypothetical protein
MTTISTTTPTHGLQATAAPEAPAPASPRSGGDPDAVALLPPPAGTALSGDSMAQLAQLLTQADEQDRTSSRQIESLADRAATQQENDRVAQLRMKADDDGGQALAGGIAGIVGGSLTVVGAFVPAAGASASASATPTATTGAAPTKMDWHELLSGASAAAPNVGGIVAGQYKAESDRTDADAAAADAHAQADIRRFDQAHSDAQAASDSIQKVEQFLDQVQQTENAARLTAATLRG